MATKPITVFRGDNMPDIVVQLFDPETTSEIDLSSLSCVVLAQVRRSGSKTILLADISCEKTGNNGDTGMVIFRFPQPITLEVGTYAIDFVALENDDSGRSIRQTAENSIMLKVKNTP
jgi:hypothetical protein